MKARYLVSCILLSTLVFFLLSTIAQATEFQKNDTNINATDIVTNIQNGNDINLTNCTINDPNDILTLSNASLDQVPNPYFKKLLNDGRPKEELIREGFNENLSVINLTLSD